MGAVVAAGALVLAPSGSWAATITVGVTNDEINADADCSLREAVQAANTNAANTTGCTDGEIGPTLDTIVLTPGTGYSRTIDPDGTPDDNQDGDLDILPFSGGPVAIQGGPSTNRATIFGGGEDRVIEQVNGSLTLTGVLLTDGSLDNAIEPGAGVQSQGTLTLVDSIVADNNAAQSGGGGIWSGGALTLQDSIVTENTAGDGGGGIQHAGGPLMITDSTIGPNHAGTEPGASSARGGGVTTAADSVTITDSVFDGNTVSGNSANGGALALTISSMGTKTITGSTFTTNDAEDQGGAIFVGLNSPTATVDIGTTRIEDNDAGFEGGGIAIDEGKLGFDASVLRRNDVTSSTASVEGGGLALDSQANATVTDSVVFQNTATTTGSPTARGGGISVGDGALALRRSSVVINSVDSTGAGITQEGGGIFVGPNAGSALVVNSTLGVNFAVDASGRGGGIAVRGGSASLVHATLYSNVAGGAADPGDAIAEAGDAAVLVNNSALDTSTVADAQDLCATDGGGDILSGGYNVALGTNCGLAATGDLQGVDPMLSGTFDHGGLQAGPPGDTEAVQTNGLEPGSAAVDHVPVDLCEDEDAIPLATDARGVPRPFGAACDSGAYELARCYGEIVDGGEIGTEGDDVFIGDGGDDAFLALAGADTLKGKGGGDRLCGDKAKDVLKGGKGKDKLDGGAKKDVCKGGPSKDKAKRCEQKSGIP